jgi:hypothetical protein
MSNIYDISRVQLMAGLFDWRVADLILVAWDNVPIFNPIMQKITAIKTSGFNELGVSLPITGLAIEAAGIAQSDAVVIPGVPVGPNVTWMTLCIRHPTVHDQSQLLLFIDDAVELPYVPNGLDIVVSPDWAYQRGWWKA